MSLTQNINDELENFGNKINLSEEVFDNDSNITIYSKMDQQNKSLKNRKKGKLYLQPNFTAFTKTNFGTIPSKVEKTLIKTDDKEVIQLLIVQKGMVMGLYQKFLDLLMRKEQYIQVLQNIQGISFYQWKMM